jgi:hypothetical protein
VEPKAARRDEEIVCMTRAGEGEPPRGDVRPIRGPVFFLSHARVPRSSDAFADPRTSEWPVNRLFEDLSTHVAELVSLPVGVDPGFLDREMDGGTRWESELLSAVGTCQVFVPLLSENYLSSEWCAREWDAFARRPVRRRPTPPSHNKTSILPVTWVPMTGALPTMVSQLQLFRPQRLQNSSVAQRYTAEGVYGLIHMRDEAYSTVVWRLAQEIVALYHSNHVEPKIARDSYRLRSSFRGGEEA